MIFLINQKKRKIILYIIRQLAARFNELSDSIDNNKLQVNLTDNQAKFFNYLINDYETLRLNFKQYGLYIELYVADVSYLKIDSNKPNNKSIVTIDFDLIFNRLSDNSKEEYLKHYNISKYLVK
jgi:phage gp36-like protein